MTKKFYGEKWEQEFLHQIGTRLNSDRIYDQMTNYLRNTITTKVHFKIENLLSNILQRINSQKMVNIGFTTIIKDLKGAGINISDDQSKILEVLAGLRNSFHSNGMRRKGNLNITINNVNFNFEEGKAIDCASWYHIVVILEANIEVIKSIVLSDKILNLDGEIADNFASLVQVNVN